jgi:hypothetical protein
MLSRTDWIQKTKFEDHTAQSLLDLLKQQIGESKSKHGNAVVIFDLDSTLFNVSPRTLAILQDWIKTDAGKSAQPYFNCLSISDIGYSLDDLWIEKKIPLDLLPVKKFWRDHFFDHDYLNLDHMMKGAREFVHQVYDAGANITYLTGRDSPTMYFGTAAQLQQHELPVDRNRTRLILKAKRHHDDVEFKSTTIKQLNETFGKIVANFENEPKNLVAMAKAVPAAKHIFIETNCSGHPAPVIEGLIRLKQFH